MTSLREEGALERAAMEALGRVLSRMPPDLRAEALRTLRSELDRCLAEAASDGSPVDADRLHARLCEKLAAPGPDGTPRAGRQG